MSSAHEIYNKYYSYKSRCVDREIKFILPEFPLECPLCILLSSFFWQPARLSGVAIMADTEDTTHRELY